jgi:hypothetical protein
MLNRQMKNWGLYELYRGGTKGSNPAPSSRESANLRSRFRDDAVRATASKMRRCWLPGSALDESQKVGVELLLMGDRQSVGCAGAAIDFVAGREVQYSRAHLFDRASHIGAKERGQVGSDRHLAASDPDIDLIDRRRIHADQRHAGADRRFGNIGQLEILRAAECSEAQGDLHPTPRPETISDRAPSAVWVFPSDGGSTTKGENLRCRSPLLDPRS